MTRLPTIRALALAIALSGGLSAQKPPAFVGAVQVPEGWRTVLATAADMNGDGRLDLVVATCDRGDDGKRRLTIHLRQESGFAPTADFSVDLQAEVTALAVGDFCSDPGLEVVLFTGNLAAIWRPGEKGAERFRDRFRCRYIFQATKNGGLFDAKGSLVDLDGDGLVDLLIPEPDGYRVALQRRGEKGTDWLADRVMSLPPRRVPRNESEKVDVARARKQARFWEKLPEFEKARTGATSRAPLVDISDETAVAYMVDFDGDGKLDLVARDPREVMVWSHLAERVAGDPDRRFEAPVVADRSRATDLAYGSFFLDFDRDKHCDSVIFAGDRRSDDPRTQVLIFRQSEESNGKGSPLFGAKGLPSQLLVLAGFTGGAHFPDVDGDGRPDLAVGALRPDILDSLRGQAKDVTEVELYVFLNKGQGFSTSPDLKRGLELEVNGLGALSGGFLARFAGDYTKDGTAELVVRDRENRIRVYWTRKDRSGGVSIFDQPLWEVAVDKDAVIVDMAATATEKAGLLILESGQVLMMRFAE